MPGADKNWNAKLVMFKDEVTEGTDSSPAAAANVYRVLNYQPQFMDADGKTRALEKAFFGADPVIMAGFKRGASFDMEIHGGGNSAGTTIPPWMLFLQYAGFGTPTATPSGSPNSVVISPVTNVTKSATHYIYMDDLLARATGSRGSVGFTVEDDEVPKFNLSVLGIPTTTLIDQTTPPALLPTGYITPLLASSEVTTFTFGGYAHALRRLTMSDNATLALRSFIGPKDRVRYTGRSWTGQMVIRIPDLNVANPFANIRSGVTAPAQIIHGTTNGNIVQIDIPALQITGNVELSNEDNDILGTFPVTALPVSGNDEVVFTSK